MKTPTHAEEAQGAETATEAKAKQPSVSYTIRQFGENAKKLKDLKLITDEQYGILKEMHAGFMKAWMDQLSL